MIAFTSAISAADAGGKGHEGQPKGPEQAGRANNFARPVGESGSRASSAGEENPHGNPSEDEDRERPATRKTYSADPAKLTR